jgi:hypothetical protein
MNKRTLTQSIILLLLVGFSALPSFCQITSGTLAGTITDASGAVVKQASVTLRDKSEGGSLNTSTSDTGQFSFPQLKPGTYDLEVAAPTFGQTIIHDVVILVGQHVLQNAILSPARVGEQVVVESVSELVDTSSAKLGEVIEPERVVSLPLKNRDFADLATLVPQIVSAPAVDPTKVRVGNISVAGTTARQSNVFVDGLEDYDIVTGGLNYDISPDAIQEFNVETSHFSAEQSHSMGAVINVIQRSGSNQLHGSGFYFFRNQALSAEDPFDLDAAGKVTKSPFHRQQSGFNIGGPFVKDTWFGFLAFEDQHEINTAIVNTNGAYPTYDKAYSIPFRRDFVTGRTDYVISPTEHLFYRFNLDDFFGLEAIGGVDDYTAGHSDGTNTQSHAGGITSTLSQRAVNTLLVGFTRYANSLNPLSHATAEQFPDLVIGQEGGEPQSTIEHRFQLKDDYLLTLRNHTLKVGGEYGYASYGGSFDTANAGIFEWFEDAPVNSPYADLLIQSACETSACTIPTISTSILGFYIQDDWKARHNLTINAGVRWDYYSNQNDKFFKGTFGLLVPPGSRKSDKHDFSPRIGFAYDPFNRGKFVARGGYGVYYQNVTLVDGGLEYAFDGVHMGYQVTVNLGGINVADPYPGLSATQIQALLLGPPQSPFDAYANNIVTPYVQYFTGGFQWQFAPGLALSFDGVHSLGVKGLVFRDVNVDANFNVAAPGAPLCQEFGTAACQDFGAYPRGYNSDILHYNAGIVTLNGHFLKRYQVNGSYTLAKADNYTDDNVGSEGVTIASNPFDVSADRGPTLNDQRHRIVADGIADLSHLLPGSGWEVGFVSTFNTPLPFDIIGSSTQNDGITPIRPAGIGRNTGARGSAAKTLALVNAFRATESLTPLGRPVVPESLNTVTTSLRLSKAIKFSDRYDLHLQGESFNLFNHLNYISNSGPSAGGSGLGSGVNHYADSNSLGLSRNTFGVLSNAGPRTFQLSARINF